MNSSSRVIWKQVNDLAFFKNTQLVTDLDRLPEVGGCRWCRARGDGRLVWVVLGRVEVVAVRGRVSRIVRGIWDGPDGHGGLVN